jgi:hypothetical protein
MEAIDRVTVAVGRGAALFDEDDEGTWQHQLLVATKKLVRAAESHLLRI